MITGAAETKGRANLTGFELLLQQCQHSGAVGVHKVVTLGGNRARQKRAHLVQSSNDFRLRNGIEAEVTCISEH